MKKEDLLDLLQDIVEQDGDLARLKTFYTRERHIKLKDIQEVIIYGLTNGFFEASQHIKTDKNDLNYDYYCEGIDLEEAISVINNRDSWNKLSNGYEVTFINVEKYLPILFGVDEHRIPDEFLQFVKE